MNGAREKKPVCIRVLIADDQPRVRHSLAAQFAAMRWSTPSPGEQPTPADCFPVEVAGKAEDAQQALEQVQALRPDVVVMDLGLRTKSLAEPRLDGVAVIRIIKSRWPGIRIVVLTMHATYRASALAAGADAFLLKGCPTSELLDAVMPGRLGKG